MTAIVLAIIALSTTVIVYIIRVTQFMTEIRMSLDAVMKQQKIVERVPKLEWRIRAVEKQLDISAPEMNGHGHGE